MALSVRVISPGGNSPGRQSLRDRHIAVFDAADTRLQLQRLAEFDCRSTGSRIWADDDASQLQSLATARALCPPSPSAKLRDRAPA